MDHGDSLDTILREAIQRLALAGIENPRLEAEILMASALQISRLDLSIRLREEAGSFPIQKFLSLVSRRSHREPLAYITGRKEFWSLTFVVTPAVLIPRPETEFVVEAALGHISAGARIVDLGTGSGNIAVCLAKEIPAVHIYAVDLSWPALQVARRNAEQHGLSGQISFLNANLLGCLASPKGSSRIIDGLVSNLPYVPTEELPGLAPEVSVFEPRLALDGGADGLDCYRCMIGEARGIMKKGAVLILEMGHGQRDALIYEIQNQGFEIQEIIPDYAGLDRVVVARLQDINLREERIG